RDFDRVMKWGFGWEEGPFAMIDMIGADKLGIKSQRFFQATPEGDEKVLGFDGAYVSPAQEPQFRPLAAYPLLQPFNTFNVRDLGDGITGIGLTTKMGVISPAAVDELTSFLSAGKIKRLVFSSEAKVFSAGFDIKFFIEKIHSNDFDQIEEAIQKFQALGRILQKIPSVAAVWGYCLGGGLEMAMSCSMIAASPETQIGLPESKVGLIPGGGGNVMMRQRAQLGGPKALAEMVSYLAQGLVSNNADEARGPGYLRVTDATVYHPDRLISEARRLVMDVGVSPVLGWTPSLGPVLGMAKSGLDVLSKGGELTQHDVLIGDRIAQVFAKAKSVEEAYDIERTMFVELCREGLSLARMKHMLETGRPLRN
ncbi:MAG: enoyl-CoA hydratase/isomerase family protein, partial [Armatimonadota bacterium]